MADVNESTNEVAQAEEKPKPTARKKAAPEAVVPEPVVLTFPQKLLELQRLMSASATGVIFDKAVSVGGGSSVEYADTQQYKMWLAQACQNVGLIFGLDTVGTFLGIISPEKDKALYGAVVEGHVTLRDVNDFDACEMYAITGFGSNYQAGFCLGAAVTNALRNFLLNGFMLDNKGREGDDQAFNAAADTPKTGYVSQSDKAGIKQGIADAKAEEAQYATVLFATALHDKILEARAFNPEFKVLTVNKHFNEDGTPKVGANKKSTMLKAKAVKDLTEAEEIIAKGAE